MKIVFVIILFINGLIHLKGFAKALDFLAFKMFCPHTVIARNYLDFTNANFAIFLPNWLAKYNKLIYKSIF